MCFRCGLVIAKVHAKRENEIVGIKDVSDSTIYDGGKTIVSVVIKKSFDHRRNMIKGLNRIDHRKNNKPQENDTDLQSLLDKGKQLVIPLSKCILTYYEYFSPCF